MSSKVSSKVSFQLSCRRAVGFAALAAVLAPVLAPMLAQPALAEEKAESVKTYERKVTENWVVQGISYPGHQRNDVCVAWKRWKDGSRMEIVKDLKTGELYLWHQTMGWNRINDAKMKSYPLRINFHDQQGNVVDGGDVTYTLLNKNTLVIGQITEKPFLAAMVNSNRMVLIPEGDVSNTQAYFDGKANDIVTVLADCVQARGKGQGAATASGPGPIEPPSLALTTKAGGRDI